MFDWDDLRYFLAIHRGGNLSAAADRLRVDPTTVGRRLSALEEELGATLFVRRRDGWTLSPAGARMLTAAERAEDAATDVVRGVKEVESVPAGRVRLTTIEMLATRLIARALPELHRRHPQIRLEVICTPRVLDLTRGECDIALRVGRPTEPSLVGRRVSTASESPYASQAYLDARGLTPDTDHLDGCEVLEVFGFGWADDLGDVRTVLRSNSGSMLLQASLGGLGVAMLPEGIADRYPDLVRLDGLGVRRERPIWMVMHRDLANVARVRAVADFVVDWLHPDDGAV